MNNLRYLIEFNLDFDKDKVHKFTTWAFGDDFKDKKLDEIRQLWNKIHGHQFKVVPNENIAVTVPHMIELWKQDGDHEKANAIWQEQDKSVTMSEWKQFYDDRLTDQRDKQKYTNEVRSIRSKN
jgi:hypothetical protein